MAECSSSRFQHCKLRRTGAECPFACIRFTFNINIDKLNNELSNRGYKNINNPDRISVIKFNNKFINYKNKIINIDRLL